MLEQGLFQLLTSQTSVSNAIETRLYPLLLPNDAVLPAATYQRVSTVSLHGLTDNFTLTQARVQIDTWGNSYMDVRTIASAITDGLEGYKGTLPNGVLVSDVVLDSQMDLYDSVARLYRVSLDFLIWFART